MPPVIVTDEERIQAKCAFRRGDHIKLLRLAAKCLTHPDPLVRQNAAELVAALQPKSLDKS